MTSPARTVAMLDLRREYELYGKELRAAVDDVLQSGQYILGPAVTQFEAEMAGRLGGDAIAISSGTDAILCALMALDVGPGDEVILPAFTFFATAGTVARVGATPIFVDIDPRTFNLDPRAVDAAVSPRTRAIICVHLFGQCADMDAIHAVAKRHNFKVIEDAAQAIGASYRGRPAGALGDIACFSFYPTKNLGGIGEGGLIVAQDADLAARCRRLRNHGESRRYHHEEVGGNFRLDSLKCAALGVKLRYLDEFTQARRTVAARYDALLAGVVETPWVEPGCEHVYHQYSVLCSDRDELATFLKSRGVSTGVYYPEPLHRQRCFPGGARVSLPVTDSICERILSLPCHPMLHGDDVEYVAACVREFVETNGSERRTQAPALGAAR